MDTIVDTIIPFTEAHSARMIEAWELIEAGEELGADYFGDLF